MLPGTVITALFRGRGGASKGVSTAVVAAIIIGSDESESSNFTIHGQNRPGGNIMKRALTALALAGTLAIATIATPTSAHAQWRRGWGWGLGGLALGLTIGAALSRPAYAYGYGYPAYSYGYGYPGYGYGYPAYSYASYGYGYPAYSYGYGYGGYYRAVYMPACLWRKHACHTGG